MSHKKPEQRAAMWLAVNAGSVLEDDDQRGLAHFVEHMAFNGTRRFAKQAIIDYIEKIGMRFGPDVNAYTSFDQTVYMLTVPTDDRKMMGMGLDILRDWAGDVSFEPDEVEKERGVVTEEWRLGRGAFARINDKQWPVMFQGSKYAERLPIGLPEVIKGAPREALVRFYEDWYRPENMAVIAVGDFDAGAMEQEIEARFGGLGTDATGTRRVRSPVPVPHDHPTAVTIDTDPEMPFSQVEVIDKIDHRPEATKSDYRRSVVEGLSHALMRARLGELALDPDSPFTFAGSWASDLTRTADGIIRFANAKQGKTAETLTAVLREIERARQHGFTRAELERGVSDRLVDAERAAAEWDKTPSHAIAGEMTTHFFEGQQMPGRPVELALNKELLPTVTLVELNRLAASWGHGQGRVVSISGPASAVLPTETEVRRLLASVQTMKVEPWQDKPAMPLMTALPTPGKVIRTTRDAGADATVWTLSNGVRVIVKPTTFQNDAIEIQGVKAGGSSLVKDIVHARFATSVVAAGGLGDLDPTALDKTLQGKVAWAWVSMGDLSETVRGSARPADLETALQLVYLRLTAPRKDERAFAVWRAQQLEWAQNRRLLPEVSFYEDMDAVRTKHHPRRLPTTPEMLAKVDLEAAHAVYRERFSNFAGMTFVIVGNVDPARLQPLVERYLGSLPSTGAPEKWKDVGIGYATGKLSKQVLQGSEPKSYVSMTFGAPDRWTRAASHDARVLSMVLQIRLREVLREDMGGVYGVRSSVSLSRQPTGRREATISFGCDPAKVEKLRDAALTVLRAIQKDGISDEVLVKVREQLRRARETDAKENWWWSNQLRDAYWFGEDFVSATELAPVLAHVTSDHVKAAARRFFDERNLVFGVLRPKAPATSTAVASAGATARP
ncbi:MAG: insulinase family protein [Nannocystis sp.]|nr:insulinase family protein [Nannocystis sp.]MBA3549493.1 insulinase family protein [Nannocystis sp.]